MYYTNIIKSISARGLFTLLALIMSISLHAQNATVKGVIVDETDTPLIGATVQVKGTATGSITDFDGNYTIKANKGAVITFSYIGYKTQESKFTGQAPLNVKMIPDNQTLDEVVVVGYGTMKKSDLTGSVSSISSDRFKVGTDLSPQQLMQGAFSGVNISQNSGKPGGSNTIRVRGGTSITASNDPLYVIDGVPINSSAGVSSSHIASNGSNTDFFDQESVNPLSSINPNDIESINILKDASATAIYGSKGANGVVLINTKRGKEGKVNVNVKLEGFYNTFTQNYDFVDGYTYACMANEAKITRNQEPLFSPEELDLFRLGLDPDLFPNVNWMDVMMRDGAFSSDAGPVRSKRGARSPYQRKILWLPVLHLT